jgi:uncharacterized protein
MIKTNKYKIFVALVTTILSLTAGTAFADILVLGGNPAGSLWYAQAQALSATVGKHSDMRVDVLPQAGTVFFPMFGTKEVDMGIGSPVEAVLAYKAEPPFENANKGKGYEMRTIMLGSPISLTLVTRKDSGIGSVAELKGKRVVANYGQFVGSTLTARSVLANAGLTVDDISMVSASSYTEGVRAVIEGRADAAVGSIGSGILQELDASVGAKLLEIDPSPEAMARTQDVGSAFVAQLVKKGPVGIDQDTYTLSYSTTIYARPDIDNAQVETFINTIWNHHQELPKIHRSLATWTPDRFASVEAVVPYHPAAIKFYKERGVWSEALDARQAELLQERKN